MATELVHLGATGVDDVLSGSRQRSVDHSANGAPTRLVDGVGERYEVLRTNIKTWSVGSPIQAPLGALQLLFKHQPFDADHESQVTVRCAASEAALVNNREMPDKFAALDTRPTLAGQRLSQG